MLAHVANAGARRAAATANSAAAAATATATATATAAVSRRSLATPAHSHSASGSGSVQHRVVIVGGGAAGQAISHQLLRTGAFPESGDIAIVDPKSYHDYQPGWTLVGAGLKTKEELRRPMSDLAGNGDGLRLYSDAVQTFQPENNTLKTRDGKTISYEHLVVVPGLGLYPERIAGLTEALADPTAKVASIYDYDSCDATWEYIRNHRSGPAIFTQPPQPHKCAGAPQKVMWLAWNHWLNEGVRNDIPITYATALPAMFAVPKYSAVLEALRRERDVEGLFGHNLTEVNGSTATFTRASDNQKVTRPFSLLHVTPPQGPLQFIKDSPLADPASGFVAVDQHTTQHTKYNNVWSAGDSSSLATSKTAAAITAQAPVLVANLLRAVLGGRGDAAAQYDGYTSCPLLTEYGKVLLAEFKYGGQPKETFASLGIDQAVPSRAFYHLKKDFFPWVYYNSYVKGTWAGPKGFSTGLAGAAVGAGLGARSFSTRSSSNATSLPPRRGFATSALAQRDGPSRRPRDPLASDAHAQRHTLQDGSVLIVRPPPSAMGGVASLQDVSASPEDADADADAATPTHMPPLLPRRRAPTPTPSSTSTSTSTATPLRTHPSDLSPAQIAEMQSLREADPLRNTASRLARRFGTTKLVVGSVAPLGKDMRRIKAKVQEEASGSGRWGMDRIVRREERRARRELW